MDKSIDQILIEYKDLVKVIVGKYQEKIEGVDSDDLIQEGMIALVRAYDSFDKDKEASFKTYASVCIENAMKNEYTKAKNDNRRALNSAKSLDEPVSEDDSLTLGDTLVDKGSSNPEGIAAYNELFDKIKNPPKDIFSKLEIEVLNYLLQGKTYKEIASILLKDPKQIDNAIQRIRIKVKKMM